MSAPPPAANGATKRTARTGYSWAPDGVAYAARTSTAYMDRTTAPAQRFRNDLICGLPIRVVTSSLAVPAGAVVDDHGLPEQLGQPRRHDARQVVGAAAGRERNNDAHRLRRKRLRVRRNGRGKAQQYRADRSMRQGPAHRG